MSQIHHRGAGPMLVNNRAPFTPAQPTQPNQQFQRTYLPTSAQQQQAPGTPPVPSVLQQQQPPNVQQQQQPQQQQQNRIQQQSQNQANPQNASQQQQQPPNQSQQSNQQQNYVQQQQPTIITANTVPPYSQQTQQTPQQYHVAAAVAAEFNYGRGPHNIVPPQQQFYFNSYLPQYQIPQQYGHHDISYLPYMYQNAPAQTWNPQLVQLQSQQIAQMQQQQQQQQPQQQTVAGQSGPSQQQNQQQQSQQQPQQPHRVIPVQPTQQQQQQPNSQSQDQLPLLNQPQLVNAANPVVAAAAVASHYAPQPGPAGVAPTTAGLVNPNQQQQHLYTYLAYQPQQPQQGQLPPMAVAAAAATQQPPQPPITQSYQKRERKPLLIVDPTTKLPVNSSAAATNATPTSNNNNTSTDVKDKDVNKTSATTQPSLSTTTNNNQTSTSNTTNKQSENQPSNSSTSTTTSNTTTTVINNNKKPNEAPTQNNKKDQPTSSTSISTPAPIPSNKPTESQNITVNTTTSSSETAKPATATPVVPATTTTVPVTATVPAPTTTTTTTAPTPFSYSQITAQAVPKTAIATGAPNKQIQNLNNSKVSSSSNNNSNVSKPQQQPALSNENKQSQPKQSDSQVKQSVTASQQSSLSTTTTTPTPTPITTDVTNKINVVEPITDNNKKIDTQQQLTEKLSSLDISKEQSSTSNTDKNKKMTVTTPTPTPTTNPAINVPISESTTTSVKLNDNNNNIDPKLPVAVKDDSKSTSVASNSSTTSSVTSTLTTTTPVPTDRWTPENKDGKKRYDREFLLGFKDKKQCQILPDAIKNNPDLMLQDHNNPNQQGGRQGGGSGGQYGASFDYGNMRSNRSNYDGQYTKGSGHKTKGRGSQSRGSQDPRQQVQVISLDRDVPIRNRAENPYVIEKLKQKNDQNELEDLLREVRNILNKLTPQNLNKLTSDLINLPINNEERLKASIDIIFEKSIDEQVFSQTYAQLCKVLSQIKVPSSQDPTKNVSFRTMLLSKCQKEFDTDFYQEINYEKLIQEVESCPDEQKKAELKELAEEKLSKAKRRSLGNIRFIGELFKLSMLTEGIMNDCIERLLKQESDEENLECLCKLLTTIGKEVDRPTNAQKMKNYFERLEKIIKKKSGGKDGVTARIRFMILDVIDLRRNQWVPRRKDNNPRRIEEIRKEAEEEQARQEAERQAQMEKRQSQKGQGGQQGQKQPYQHSLKSTSMDSESFRANKAQNGTMASKIKDVKTITTKTSNTELTLGPGGGTGFSWNKTKVTDTSSTSASTATSSYSTTLKPSSTFSFNKPAQQQSINESGESKRSNVPSSTSVSSLLSSQFNKSNAPSAIPNRLSMESNKSHLERTKYLDAKSSMDGSQQSLATSEASSSRTSSRGASISRDNSRSRDQLSTIKRQAYTSDEIERKANNTIDEYIQNKDLTESLKDFDDFRPVDPAQYSEFMTQIINAVLERNDLSRQSIGNLFFNAIKLNKIEVKHFVESLKTVLESAEEMAIDVPLITNYLSQIIGSLFQKDFSVEFLLEACEPIKSKRICADFIAEVLHSASNRLGHNTVTEIFKYSNLRIHDFLNGVTNHAEFIKEKKIEWIMGNRERTQSASVSTESFESKLYEILENPKDKNETIFDKIENEFGECDFVSKPFIRALVISVCRSCYIDNKIDAAIFKERSSILTKYIARNEEFELEALFAVQALDHRTKHQPGVIRVLCDLFYDEDIIREDVFWKWKSASREEGHAISALSLKGFFEWLSETEAATEDAH